MVRPGQHRPDRGTVVGSRVQPVQPRPLVPELGDQVRQARRGPGDGQLGGDPQRQRQPGAAFHERHGGYRLGGDPAADQGPQQVQRLRGGQPGQVDPPGAVPGHQPGQAVPAGHQGQAGRRAGQQRADRLGGPGVVQQYQDLPVGEQAAVPGAALGQVVRDVGGTDPERAQEAGQHLARVGGLLRPVPAQVDVQLAVREVLGHPVRPVHGQRRLADPGGTGQGHDHAAGPADAAGQPVQLGDLGVPAGEPVHVGGQFAGDRGPGAAGPATGTGGGPAGRRTVTASLASSSCQRCVHSSVEPPHAPTYASVTDSDGRVTPPAAADSAAAEYPARRANAR